MTNGPLEGVRILDFTQVLAGPYCTQILGDMGADVIKVEPPGGDATRKWGPPFQGVDSAYFHSVNRNKKSIVLDLTKQRGREIAKNLAKSCDVIVENFRPGVMAKLDLSYASIRKVSPDIIYCSISGYGQTGPLKNKPGYDIAAYAASGIMSITGEEGGGPVKTGVPIADIGAGLFAAIAINSSLLERERRGEGAYIDIALYDSMISWLTFQAGLYFATGENPKKMGSAHPLLVPYQAFRAKDRFFILAVGSDSIWESACTVIGIKRIAKDSRFRTASGRQKNRKYLLSLLQSKFLQKKAEYWLSRFEKAGVPCSSIRTVGEALASEHTKERKMLLRMRHKSAGVVRSIASPVHIYPKGKSYRKMSRAPPGKGENTNGILRQLGYSSFEVDRLRKAGVVF
ncbi:MAG: CaiB/BaiF CoA transferase family protein [Nitrososphaerales archaeon]